MTRRHCSRFMRALARHGLQRARGHVGVVTGRFKGDIVGLLGNSLVLRLHGTMGFSLLLTGQRVAYFINRCSGHSSRHSP